MPKSLLEISAEVTEALNQKKPIVALESTVISHGLPYPENREVAMKMQEAVRKSGAVPAVIALMNGSIKIGLDREEIERLATSKNILKVNRGDIGFCLSQNRLGATTVSATMFGAFLAGIKVFATGGIGGVHRGAETTFDISADLTELARTPVLVVCSGAKSILDVPKTLEYLETQGVPVIGYKTDKFPLFYTQQSDYPLLQKLQDPLEIAQLARVHWLLGLQGLVVANPVPLDKSLESQEIEHFIEIALEESSTLGITGKAVTPFMLKRVSELSKGRTLSTNKALLIYNATVAGEIASAFAEL